MAEKRKSFFETPLMRTKIKSATVSLFPEAALGFLLGPILALLCNGVVNIWLVQYWDKVLNLGEWGSLFEVLLPVISAILIIVGNIVVGKLMERKPTLAGKARPLLLIAMPFVAIALLVMFLVPFPEGAGGSSSNVLAMIMIAVGYNLFYAIAWPLYYTSHSALVNLSTRDGGKRGLLSTAIMAAQLAASGASGMFGGYIVKLLKLLPTWEYTNAAGKVVETSEFADIANKGIAGALTPFTQTVTATDANSRWTILVIVMTVAFVIGCALEYFFSRERITEEAVKNAEAMVANGETAPETKKATMSEQIKICVKDKYWWLIIIFFFLYQFGGQMKNNAMSFFSLAMTGDTVLSSNINTIGAIPTAVGMALVWPLANKLTKSKTIILGCILAFVSGMAGYAVLIPAVAGDPALINVVSIGTFCLKALGTAPAMYISLALMANVLDHQEAVHGIRTDGFTMAVYGAIMVALPGVCNGIILGLKNVFYGQGIETYQAAMTTLSFGVEAVCYLVMGAMFIFMNVEKFTKIDNLAIVADQKAKVLAAGGEWVEPAVRAEQEAAENARLVEEARVDQLKKDCEKKGLDFDAENEKFLAKKAENDAKAAAKKADADAKKAAKEAAIPAEVKEARAAKEAEALENARVDLNKARVAAGLPEYVA